MRFLALLLGLSFLGCKGESVSVTLEEVHSEALPAGLEVLHVEGGPNGRIAVRTGVGLFILEGPGRPPKFVGAFDVLDVVGFAPLPDGLELVDARTRRVIIVSDEGAVRDWWDLPEGGVVEAAARMPCGWVTLVSNGVSVQARVLGAQGHVLARYDVPYREGLLASGGSQVVVTEAKSPFRLALIDCDAGVVLRELSAPPPSDSVKLWRSLPGFASGGSVVRTLADMSSNTRRIDVFPSTGRATHTFLDLPLGLVGSICGDLVVGVRTFGESEATFYSGLDGALPSQDLCPWRPTAGG